MTTLKDLRERAMLSQSELAQMIGVHQQTVHTWESGRFKPLPRYQRKLVEALRSTPDELLAALKETQERRKKGEKPETENETAKERPAA
jgi:DNA-binding XRE family transcriptional regulator